jgi:hypothetical protein
LGPKPDLPKGVDLVTVSDGVRVRSKPGVATDSVKYDPVLEIGTDLQILEGPVAASGYWWYRIRLEDGLTLRNGVTTGWVAAADHNGEPWIGEPGLTECCDTDPVPEPDPLPSPVLVMDGTEAYTAADGNRYTRYNLSVVNWTDYPGELFEAAPDLEPCGLSAAASRTWVNVLDGDSDEDLYGFCGFGQPEDLTSIWFAVAEGTPPPARVYVGLTDRRTGSYAESNRVATTGNP